MKKTLKLIGKVLLGAVIVVVSVVLALPLWIGPVVRGVSQKIVPGITGTDFHMGEFGLNIYSGRLHVGDTQLANPTNYSEKNAVELGALDVNVAMTSLLSKKTRIESIDLDGLTVYSSPSAGNFRDIADHASGGEKAEEQPEAEEQPAAEEPSEEPQQGGGLQIDRITLKNITIKYGVVPVKIPMTIELTDIGKDKEEGASWTDVWNEAYGKVMSAAGAVTGAVGDLGKAGLGAAAGALGSLADAATDVVSGGEAEGAEGVKASVAEGVEAVSDKVGGVAAAVLDAVKEVGSEVRDESASVRKRVRSAVNTGGLFK